MVLAGEFRTARAAKCTAKLSSCCWEKESRKGGRPRWACNCQAAKTLSEDAQAMWRLRTVSGGRGGRQQTVKQGGDSERMKAFAPGRRCRSPDMPVNASTPAQPASWHVAL